MRKLNVRGGFWLTIGQDYRGTVLGDNWTPAELSPFAEYDAQQGSDLTGFMTDNSGNGRDLSTYLGSPTYGAAIGPNSTAGVEFTNDAAFWSGSGQSPNDFSYAFLVQPNTFANFDAIIGVYSGTGGATSAGSMGFTFRDYATDRALWPFVEGAYPLTRFEFLAGDWLLVSGYYTDGDSAMYLNGALMGSVSDAINPIQINRIDLGTYNGGGVTRAPDDVIFSYASIIDRKMTTEERQKSEGYLAWTRGLESSVPNNHPYRFDGSLFGYSKLWSPFEFSPNAWYDAADETTISENDASGRASHVDYQSGNDNHITQGTAANQPATGSRTENGLNVLAFDGVAYDMDMPTAGYTIDSQRLFCRIGDCIRCGRH